jgi:hypothetical protein
MVRKSRKIKEKPAYGWIIKTDTHILGSRNPLPNPLNAELNLICYLLALLRAHHIFHVRGLRFNRGNI